MRFGRTVALAAALAAAFARADVPPVRLAIRPAGAREAPPTVEDMLFMAARPARREWNFNLPSVSPVTNGFNGVRWYEGGWKRPIYLFEYSGLVNVPEGGDYTFFVHRPEMGPAYFLVNGEVLVDFPNRGGMVRRRPQGGPQGQGQGRGRGPRGRGNNQDRDNPNGNPPSAIPPQGISVATFTNNWIEGATIHLERGPAEFRALGFCEQRAAFGILWKKGGQEPHPISPELFARAERMRYAEVSRPLEYRAAEARLAGVPSFCFPEDAVRPEIHVRSDITNLEVSVRVEFARGAPSPVAAPFAATSSVHVVRGWGRLETGEWRAAECARIAWEVRDRGVVLAQGAARFVHPPFHTLPAGVDGDALVGDDGERLVFVTRRHGRMTEPFYGGGWQNDGAILVDGFGGAASNLVGKALERAFDNYAPVIGKTVSTRDLVSTDAALFGRPDLLEVVAFVKLAKERRIVLAPEIRGFALGEDLDAFERRLSAVVGLLSEAAGCTLMLVTPPPEFRPFGGAGDMRAYAAAVHRVADAYGLRVADVYTLARNAQCTMHNAQ